MTGVQTCALPIWVTYPGLRQRVAHWQARLSSLFAGIPTGTNAHPLSVVLGLHRHLELFPATNQVVYLGGRLDADRVSIYPVVTSNRSGIHPVRMQLAELLASNGLTLVRVRKDAIKIYPTEEDVRYQKAPLP